MRRTILDAVNPSTLRAGVALLAVLLLITAARLPAFADQGPGIAVEPATVSIPAGGAATVDLIATAPPQGLGSWAVDLSYDPSVVVAIGCTADVQGALAVCNPAFQAGRVRAGGASGQGLTGSVSIATITFQAVGAP